MAKHLSYEEVETLLKDSIITIITNNQQVIDGMAYAGFNPKQMFSDFMKLVSTKAAKTKKRENDVLTVDVVMLMALFHQRGPNVSRVNIKNTVDSDSIATINQLIADYGIKSKAQSDGSAITLPRLSMIFPSCSMMVFQSLHSKIISFAVSENELGIKRTQTLSGNFTPCLLDFNKLNDEDAVDRALFIHNIYQSYLSYKTQDTKTKATVRNNPLDFMTEAVKYSGLSMDNSLASKEGKLSFEIDILKNHINITHDDILEGMIKCVKILPLKSLGETPTKYHVLLNYMIKMDHHISDIEVWKMSTAQIEADYS